MAAPKKQSQFGDVSLEPVSEGVIMEGVLSHYVSPKGAVSYTENMHNDTIGMMTTRRPFVNRITPAANVLSCVLYQDGAGTPLVATQQGTTFQIHSPYTGNTLTSTAAIMDASLPARYDMYKATLVVTPPASGGQPRWVQGNGTLIAIAGSAFPTRKDLVSVGFDSRLWMADSLDGSCRLYFSDPLLVGNNLGDTTGGTGYIVIPAENGDLITALIKTQRCLYVFTHNSIFRVFNTVSSDNVPVSYVGTYSQEAVVKAKNGFYFYNPTGIFYMQDGGNPQEIGIKVRDILKKVSTQQQVKVFGWADDDHVVFCLGNKLTGYEPNKTYYVRYTISTQVWSIYSTLNFLPSCADQQNSTQMFSGAFYSGDETIFPTVYVFGNGTNSAGVINTTRHGGTINVYTPSTEDSTIVQDWNAYPIPVEYQTNWMTFDMESQSKFANGLFVPSLNAAGMKVSYQLDNDLPNVWREIGTLGTSYVTAFDSWKSEEFKRIKFRFYGQSNGTTMQIGVPKIRLLDNLGYSTN